MGKKIHILVFRIKVVVLSFSVVAKSSHLVKMYDTKWLKRQRTDTKGSLNK